MAKPRVFVSSTYYDLKYVRSSLEGFINSLGFNLVLFERGGVAFAPDMALDDSCYREVQNCDIYVLIIGGRYGSEKSETKAETMRAFFEAYESVTKEEYRTANSKNIPVYILIDKSVYAEYQTFKVNQANESIKYAHVDNSGVFRLIDEVLSHGLNNPMSTFDKCSEIEEWLRSQWAGLYRELLSRLHNQKQIATLTEKIEELGEVSTTLRRYLEDLLSKLLPESATEVIKQEEQRLQQADVLMKLGRNRMVEALAGTPEQVESLTKIVKESESLSHFFLSLGKAKSLNQNAVTAILQNLSRSNNNQRSARRLECR